MHKPITIGIDLGTTNSLCTVFRDGATTFIPNAHGEFLTPSVVGVLEDERIVVGQPARELSIVHPDRCVSCFKRDMGTNQIHRIGSYQFSAPELSSIVLMALKEDAERFFGQPVEQAVVTVPAYFNDHQRKATVVAAELAKLKVLRIVNEPTAAALTYGFHESDADKRILVFDLGGGTFDVTLMEIFEGSLEIIATAGESSLGGEDFTMRMVSHVLATMGLSLEAEELNRPLMVARLQSECEKAKRALATSDSVAISIPESNGELSGDRKFDIDAAQFGRICQELTDRLKSPVSKVLSDANLSPAQVDEVILVGGATRMPLITDYVFDFFGKSPKVKHDPDRVVAQGASIQAALIEDDSAVSDMVMTDVCPHTLGIHIVKEFDRQMRDGYFMPIIHRNTTIPVSREDSVFTMYPNQKEVLVEVYQGESRRIEHNLRLGELRVVGLPPAERGLEVAIRFTYDCNGILDVEALVPALNRKFGVVLTNHVKSLSEAEIAEAVRRLQKVKLFPRDDLENQRLLLFAERVIAEVNPHHRAEMEDAVDRYENALLRGAKEDFEYVKERLVGLLHQAGFPYNSQGGTGE